MVQRDLLVFYGDDFTGSTDVLLQYQRYGLEGMIFLGEPTVPELREAAERHQVIGVAGVTRALGPEAIEQAIEPVFRSFRELEPRFVQYKVCSTADSSPEVGSFGPALRLGRELWGERPAPVLVAQPNLGRYTVFSNHFAVYRGDVYRLDRQPIMKNHPSTPMGESDLREHLARQVEGPVSGLTVNDLATADTGAAAYRRAVEAGATAVVVDAITDEDLMAAGTRVLSDAKGETLFAIGSGGLSSAIAAGLGYRRAEQMRVAGPARGPCLAVSGSCSQLTSDQIAHALARGWVGIKLELPDDASGYDAAVEGARRRAVAALRDGRSAVVYSFEEAAGKDPGGVDVARLSEGLAAVIQTCRKGTELERVLVAGGDTSGHVITALGAKALRSKGLIDEHALLCEIDASDPLADGLEVVLKGGQIGGEDFFEAVRRGEMR